MTTRPRHERNRQGTGERLRADILAAASRILETTGNEDAVTLRAVARQAGITAPAIYAHFADRESIRATVVGQTFDELAAVLGAVGDGESPAHRLRSICRAYLAFAAGRPHHYRLLFERHRAAREDEVGPAAPDVQSILGADAFGVLLDAVAACIRSGASSADDPVDGATRVWIGLHGQASLRASLPWFPWPPVDVLGEEMLTRLADLV